jgi:HNH endonuclease
MPNHYYPAVGKCIYCGETRLPPGVPRFGDEHIIPFSMGGTLILQEASCKRCEKVINRQIETPVTSQEWGDLRAKRKFPTRNKLKRKKRTHVRVRAIDGSLMRLPLADHSTPVLTYKFSQARILSGLPRLLDDMSWSAAVLASHDEELAMRRKYPEWDKTHRIVARPYPFARLLAKIAHGYAVAEYGTSRLDAFTPLTTDIILGQSDDYFYTVGGSWDIHPAIPGGDHITDISVRFVAPNRALLIIDIRLFSQIETPNIMSLWERLASRTLSTSGYSRSIAVTPD